MIIAPKANKLINGHENIQRKAQTQRKTNSHTIQFSWLDKLVVPKDSSEPIFNSFATSGACLKTKFKEFESTTDKT